MNSIFQERTMLKIDANVQLRRAEPDAPYRKTDVYPIEIFCRNLSDPLKTAKNLFNLHKSRMVSD